MDAEAAMVKALGDNFFWESTTRHDTCKPREVLDVIHAQKKFRAKKANPFKHDPTQEVKERFEMLRGLVAMAFGLTVEDIRCRHSVPNTAIAKNFLMWAATRYFTQISLTKLATIVERHHTTLTHGRQSFDDIAHLHGKLIAEIDRSMGYK